MNLMKEFLTSTFKRSLAFFKKDLESICRSESLFKKINQEIRLHDKKFGQWEQVKAIRLTPEVWSVEGGHLTPTMKVKRKVIMEKYKNLIDDIYK